MANYYYNEAGLLLGVAQSYMACRLGVDHSPHIHWSRAARLWGPYMCGGLLKVTMYNTKPRKSVN